MAKILYEVKKDTNTASRTYGMWFGYVKSLETLNTRKLANHISEHGSIYTPDVVYGVLEKFRSCLIEMLLNSKKVKIEGLGTFYTTIENTKGGAESKEDYTPQKNMKALHIRFLPEQLPRRTSPAASSSSRPSSSASTSCCRRRKSSRDRWSLKALDPPLPLPV